MAGERIAGVEMEFMVFGVLSCKLGGAGFSGGGRATVSRHMNVSFANMSTTDFLELFSRNCEKNLGIQHSKI